MSERNWGKKSHTEMSREYFFPKNYHKSFGKKDHQLYKDIQFETIGSSDLQTPLSLPEFFPIDQQGLPYSDH